MATSKRLAEEEKQFYLLLLESMTADLQRLFPDSFDSLSCDMVTLRNRVGLEGFTFLTTTLPKLGKAIDKGLETGVLEPPREFKTRGKVPILFESLTARIFERNGLVRDEVDVDALRAIRQISSFAYRLEFPFDDKTVKKTLDNFVSTEQELKDCVFSPYEPITARAKEITTDIFEGFDPFDIVPRHGPGSVATGEKGDLKYNFKRLYSSIHQVYPYYDYFVVGGGKELLDRLDWYKSLERLEAGHSKVVLVPKDSRGPRLICCEPLEYQWIQQGLGRKLCSFLQYKSGGCIQFSDQSINQKLALSSSSDGSLATIDMKDASDRVSLKLIEAILPSNIVRCLKACRTVTADLPDGRSVDLAKHAPMGSCLCFPIEALCFYALAVAAVEFELGVSRYTAMRSIHVYGDDIIIPVDWFNAVTSTYESWRLKVNYDKSFWKGSFRESCGTDAYKGVDVTPVKFRTLWSGGRGSDSALVSWVEYANALFSAGYIRSGEFIRRRVTAIYGPIPYGIADPGSGSNSGFICWDIGIAVFSHARQGRDVVNPPRTASLCLLHNRGAARHRWNPKLQVSEIHARGVKPTLTGTILDSWTRLLRNLTQGSGEFPDLTAVPHSASVRWGWYSY